MSEINIKEQFQRMVFNHRTGSAIGAFFFTFWIAQRFYFHYRPTFLWWLVTAQFCLFVAAYLTRMPAYKQARGFWEVVFPVLVAGMPFALDNYPFKPRGYPLEDMKLVAMALMISGTFCIVSGIFFLRRSFSIMTEVRKPVFRGIYQVTRHPMYLGSMLASLGLLFYYFSWINIFIYIVFLASQSYRATREEKKIASVFPEYRDYAGRVGWFLWIGRRKKWIPSKGDPA